MEGVEHLKLDSGCVVLMNHQSSLDVLAMLEIWPHLETGAAIIKKSLIYTPFFGPAAWLIGSIFVDRLVLNCTLQYYCSEIVTKILHIKGWQGRTGTGEKGW